MANHENNVLAQYRAMVENRVREQIARHQNANPNADPRRAVEIQMQQERELLERLIEDDDTTPDQAEMFRLLIQWLPELGRRIIGR
jgi:hypothetical protein